MGCIISKQNNVQENTVEPSHVEEVPHVQDDNIEPSRVEKVPHIQDVNIEPPRMEELLHVQGDNMLTPRVEEGNYTLQHLINITNTFTEDREIGRGGFGVVYKGTLPDGGAVAVKRLENSVSIHNSRQFANEVRNLIGLEHTNIVQLMGYCHGTRLREMQRRDDGRRVYSEVEERLLCFEYLSNGSLDRILSDQSRGFVWGMHLEIIKGISLGLSYLHEQRQNGPIIHLDLKPANILLDGNMVPKIADFGLSRLFGPDKTRTITQHVVGSIGYMAPEYLDRGEISTKVDVFSLGIVILEIVTGQANPSRVNTKSSLEQYITNVRQNWATFAQVISRYPSLELDCLKEVTGCIEIGITCVDINPRRRPTAGQINYMLSKVQQLNDGQIFIVDEISRNIGYVLSGRVLDVTWSNDTRYWIWRPVPSSRFAECLVLREVCWFHVIGEIPTRDIFADTTYGAYLVYRLRREAAGFQGDQQESSIRLPGGRVLSTSMVCLDPAGDRSHDDDVTYPVKRSDGWLELKLGEFVNNNELQEEEAVIADVRETSDTIWKEGLIIEGMEFRPKS